MNTRRKIGLALATVAMLVGVGGAVVAANPVGGAPYQVPAPAGPSADLPEPGDIPDAPGQ
jgi:hypothetical protein